MKTQQLSIVEFVNIKHIKYIILFKLIIIPIYILYILRYNTNYKKFINHIKKKQDKKYI
jgi:hypothetical protein